MAFHEGLLKRKPEGLTPGKGRVGVRPGAKCGMGASPPSLMMCASRKGAGVWRFEAVGEWMWLFANPGCWPTDSDHLTSCATHLGLICLGQFASILGS
jgi:hypothetical protein